MVGSNCLESFSKEKIPGGLQGFKSHSAIHSHGEERGVYTTIICNLQSNIHKQELTGEPGITFSHVVGHHPLMSFCDNHSALFRHLKCARLCAKCIINIISFDPPDSGKWSL